MLNADDIKQLAADSGFDLCGITTPDIIPGAKERYQRWLKQGFHGELEYMASDPDRRCDPKRSMPSVRSVIMLGMNYYYPDSMPDVPHGKGRVSRYARGRDYHKVIRRNTKSLIRRIRYRLDKTAKKEFRWFVDYGPMLERAYAEKAGLGFIGRNGMLINRKFGSWVFLSEILTDLELAPDDPNAINHGGCGKCRRCIDVCPTGAIVEERVVDARKCISYLTIERPTEIPLDLARRMDSCVLGCDICQDICPHNRRAKLSRHRDFDPRTGVGEFLDCDEILELDSREDSLRLTAGTPLTRPRLEGLQRNATIVRTNQTDVSSGE
jgi:epoxyqueuosine reductase